MIDIVVVTHGQLATELLNAAEVRRGVDEIEQFLLGTFGRPDVATEVNTL